MNKYIILHSNCEKDLHLLSDLRNISNVEFEDVKIINNTNKFTKKVQKIHCSHKINKIIKLPLRRLWYKFNYYKFDDNTNYFIIVYGDVFFLYDISVFKYLKKKSKNVHFILILVDSINIKTQIAEFIREIYNNSVWDYVFSYDFNDCEKYGMSFLNYCYYSKPKIEIKNNLIINDVNFCGTLKPGRKEKIIELFEFLDKNGVKCDFCVVRYLKNDTSFEGKGFRCLDKKQSYYDCIKDIQKSKCIIEYLQDGQDAQTLRYFEAVCFNKKLLTNNENVKKLPFYNPKYMKCFKKIEDIDIEWLKEDCNVDYKYNGEFSPVHFIEKIKELYLSEEDK